jgi:hypothetical protein
MIAECGDFVKTANDILVAIAVNRYGLAFITVNTSRFDRPLPLGRLRSQSRRSAEQGKT